MELELLSGQRQKGESDNAVIACNDWLRLGAGRTLSRLLEKYTESYQKVPPTSTLQTLKNWSSRFNWSSRAVDYDATWEARKTAERNAEFDHDIALDYERVRKLKRLAGFLEQQIFEVVEEEMMVDGLELDPATGQYTKPEPQMVKRHPNVWVRDIKGIGKGADFEKVTIERFNPAIFSEYRSVLDDIAKEVGGRIKRQELTGKDGSELIFKIVYPDAHD